MSAKQQQSRTGKRPAKPAKAQPDMTQVAELQETVERLGKDVDGLKEKVAGMQAPAAVAAPRATAAKDGKRETVTISVAGAPTITDRDYAATAERLMAEFRDEGGLERLTTTKLRGIYGLVTNVYTRVNTQADFERHASDIQYLRVRMAYEAGREKAVKAFFDKCGLMALAGGVGDLAQFRLYCRYAEALVAYFKFFGGKD